MLLLFLVLTEVEVYKVFRLPQNINDERRNNLFLFSTETERRLKIETSGIYLISLFLTSYMFLFWCKEFWIIALIILLIVYILGKSKHLINAIRCILCKCKRNIWCRIRRLLIISDFNGNGWECVAFDAFSTVSIKSTNHQKSTDSVPHQAANIVIVFVIFSRYLTKLIPMDIDRK